MKYSDELRLALDLIILVLVIGYSIICWFLYKRIEHVRGMVEYFMHEMNRKTYHNAKIFVAHHENLPGLSEFEQMQLEGAKKAIIAFEKQYPNTTKN